ncbi:hypothetical protein LINPERPRIM_LOCUS34492 [Linum perenne]
MLNKHFEKLIQCDMRLNVLSQQPEMVLDSPYFEQRTSVFIDLDESNDQKFNSFETEKGSYASHSSSFEFDRGGHTVTSSEHMSREAPSPSSGMHDQVLHVVIVNPRTLSVSCAVFLCRPFDVTCFLMLISDGHSCN